MTYLTYLEILPQKLREAGATEKELAKLIIDFYEVIQHDLQIENLEENKELLEKVFNIIIKTIEYKDPKEGYLKLFLKSKISDETSIYRVSSELESDEKVRKMHSLFNQNLFKTFKIELLRYSEDSKTWQISKIYEELV